MFLSNASVRRPVAMGCLLIALTLLGANSWRKLGLELMPKMDMPFITVVTVYPGATPADIETDVAKRIEDAVVSVDGLRHVSSSCMENVCQTLLEFELEVNVDIAATDVREKLDLIRADLPASVEDPIIQKYDVNAKPIITLALTGTVPLDELYDYADNELKDRLTTIAGVAEVQLIGGAEREVHVALDRQKLAARGLTAMHVVDAVQKGVGIIPSGRVREKGTEFSVKYDADFRDERDIGEIELAGHDGARCRIRDVGTVRMAAEELRQKAAIDGRAAIAIKVVKKADANAVDVAAKVRAAMERIRSALPGGMELVWFADDGRFIEANAESAWSNVYAGIVLTAAILFLFLYNVRTLVIVCMTMPLTILIGLFTMEAYDLTLNTSTLIAIGMSVGILVTNSIVVLEAIDKRLVECGDPVQAAMQGASESWIAVLASAGTNVVVLFPLAVMGSMVGRFISPLALTMFLMTLVSLFISFTLTPMLCAMILKPRDPDARGILPWMERRWNAGFEWVVEQYRGLLLYAEHLRWAAVLVVVGSLGLLVHSFKVAGTLGGGFISNTDMGQVTVKLEFPTYYSLDETVRRVAEAERRLKDMPDLRHILVTIGKVEGIIGQSSEGVYLAQVGLRLPERDERTRDIETIMDDVRARLADYSDAIVTVAQPSIIGGTGAEVEMEISGSDFAILDRLALATKAAAEKVSGIRDPDTTVRGGKPEIRIRPRRDVLSDMGGSSVSIGQMLRANIEGLQAGTFRRNARNYDIVVKLAEEPGKDQVPAFQVPGAPGKPVLIENVARIEEGLSPSQITRVDKSRVQKVFTNLGKGMALGKATEELGTIFASLPDVPPGYRYRFGGKAERMTEAQVALGEAGLIAILLVVLTLAAILESFRQMFLILVTIPLSLIGTFWGLALTGNSLGIFEIMGIVMMAGIVVNNAILIVDQFNRHIAEGFPRHRAMIQASCESFRPVAMITLAAVLGMLPMAMDVSIGGELRTGVGIASVGGILVSGILAQILVPVLYDLCTKSRAGRDGIVDD